MATTFSLLMGYYDYYYYYYIVHKVQIRNITHNPTANNIQQQTAFTNTEKNYSTYTANV